MENKEIIERLQKILAILNADSIEQLVKAFPDAKQIAYSEYAVCPLAAGIAIDLIHELIGDIENGKVH